MALEQKYQYNGIELTNDFGLMINEARYRTLDPQLGRWWQLDPEVEQFEAWSAYNSNLDNPIRYEDKDGDTPGGGDKNDKTLHPAFTPEGGFCGGGSFGGCNSFRNSGNWSKPNASSKLTMAPRVAPKPAAKKDGDAKPWYTVIQEKGLVGKEHGSNYATEQANGAKLQREVKSTTDKGVESFNDVVYTTQDGITIQENKFVSNPDKIQSAQDAKNILRTNQRATVNQLQSTGKLSFQGTNAEKLQDLTVPVAQYNVAISDNTQVVKVYQLYPEQKQIYPPK